MSYGVHKVAPPPHPQLFLDDQHYHVPTGHTGGQKMLNKHPEKAFITSSVISILRFFHNS